ncbi:MAG: helix-turn-helix transcriptional regulator [Anaerolineae bacterium]|nr:helix-turn-helix transcriptional regulator [Anaerolineae bacterium]
MAEALPLTEATTFILLSLADEAKHGYAIMKDVEALSEGRVELSTGTLYGALSRLLDQGWIARCESEEDERDTPGRPRKTYTLTQIGRRVLEAEIVRLDAVLEAASLRTAEAVP